MEVYLGNYVVPDDNAPYQRQRAAIKEAIETYGPDHVAGITVGNEFMLKYVFVVSNAVVRWLIFRQLPYRPPIQGPG